MSKFKVDTHAEPAHDPAPAAAADTAGTETWHGEASPSVREEIVATVATIGVVAVGAALIEVSLIPGIAIGVAAALAPKYMTKLGTAVQPLLRSTVREAYKLGRKAQGAVAEAKEHISDIAAEVHAEEVAETTAKA